MKYIWMSMEKLRRMEEGLVERLRAMEEQLGERLGQREDLPIAMTEIEDGSPVKVIYLDGVVIGRTDESERGYRRLRYYHIPIAESVPVKTEEPVDVLQELAERISRICIEKGKPIEVTISEMLGRTLSKHPFATIALENAKIRARMDPRYTLGWEKEFEVKSARVNLIIIKGYECPFSEIYLKEVEENLKTLLDLGICPMILEETEDIRVGQTYGGTPVTIVADQYFRKKREVVGAISMHKLLEVSKI